MKITPELISKIDEGLSHGLSLGLGQPIPGQMCVEALICNVLGEPHNDKPSCVDLILNKVKIQLNDASWSSNQARAKGLRNLAILQLGTKDNFDSKLFSDKLATFTCTDFLPWFFEKMNYDFITKEMINDLREAKTFEEMQKANYAATAANYAAATYHAASYAAASVANTASVAAADAYAADARASVAAADAAARAAYAAAYAAATDRDEILTYFIKSMEKILIDMNVPAKDFID
jgi:hypothetical protein